MTSYNGDVKYLPIMREYIFWGLIPASPEELIYRPLNPNIDGIYSETLTSIEDYSNITYRSEYREMGTAVSLLEQWKKYCQNEEFFRLGKKIKKVEKIKKLQQCQQLRKHF